MSTNDIGFMKKKYLSNTPCVWLSVQCVLVVLRKNTCTGTCWYQYMLVIIV